MEIIMLIGETDQGKTAALHFVHEILVADEAKPTCVQRVGAENQRDFTDVLVYHEKKIMIFTMGDIKVRIEEAVKEALYVKNCDFLICACNNKFYENLKNKEYHPIKKTEKEGHYKKLAANWDDANKIIKRLKERIPNAKLSVTQIAPAQE